MKKINFKNYRLISDHTYDYFHPDVINKNIIKDGQDGQNFTVDELTEEQAKACLCLALDKIYKTQKKNDKLINDFMYK